MDFAWSRDESELLEQARRVGAQAREHTHSGAFDRAQWDRFARFGLAGLSVEQAWGGDGLGPLLCAGVFEAIASESDDLGPLFAQGAHLFACVEPIATFGSEALKHRWLRELARGEKIAGNAITEAGAGSDALSLTTQATRRGDAYVLRGEKTWVTNAPVADCFVVYARTSDAGGYFGTSAFIVDRNLPGVEVGAPHDKIGLEGSESSTVAFNGVEVPLSARLGEEGQGGPIFFHSMAWERACLGAMYVGRIERAIRQTVEFLNERAQFGKPLAANQVLRHRVAAMHVRLEASRLLLYRACWELDRSPHSSDLAIATAKVAISEAAVACGAETIQLHGSLGVVRGAGVETLLLDALPGRIFSGTSEIQHELIAKRLGLRD